MTTLYDLPARNMKKKGEKMKCFKCGKEIDRDDNEKLVIEGVAVKVILDEGQRTPENITYYNRQLGKYSNGNGGCNVSTCFECYIDGMFHLDSFRQCPKCRTVYFDPKVRIDKLMPKEGVTNTTAYCPVCKVNVDMKYGM